MPYIKEEDRKYVNILHHVPRNAGELNWLLTIKIRSYIEKHGECYQTYNDIIGALEGAKLELYRRKIAPYEDKKIKENGDVY